MATCAASSTRLAVTSSCRVRKTRTLASAQLSLSGGSPSWGRYSSFHSHSSVARRKISTPLSHSNAAKHSLSTLSTNAAAALCCEAQDRETQSFNHLFLSSAMLVFTLGFVTATASPATDPGSSGPSSGANLSHKGGGGGGPLKPYTSAFGARKNAEEDVRQVEEEAKKDPYTISAGAVQGARWTMEDTYSVENGGRFVAVFDGHGGSEVSATLRDELFDLYSKVLPIKHWEERDDFNATKTRIPSISSHVAALRRALEQVEEGIVKQDDLIYQGSTAVAVVLHVGEDGTRTLLSANVGDSRAVLSRKGSAVDLTRDHKPNDEREKARIRALGEEIEWDPYGELYRVRDLSLSRAIGDRFAKPAVSSEAEIKHFPVADADDEFILLASDGLWDVMTSQEAVDYVHESLQISESDNVEETAILDKRKTMARIVTNEALERGSADNVCVIIVWLKDAAAKK